MQESEFLSREIENTWKNLDDFTQKKKVMLGLDGFVDQLFEVVDVLHRDRSYERISEMDRFGKKIQDATGLSSNFELKTKCVKLGGNGPILANALKTMGAVVDYIGAAGVPEIHPIFNPLKESCRIYSLCNPSSTYAFEFDDGKLIFSELKSFDQITWERIAATVGLGTLKQIIEGSSLVGFENWTMIPDMTNIWKSLLDEIFSKIEPAQGKMIFFDLADPAKRDPDDIREAIRTIQSFSPYAKVILGLNQKEAAEILSLFEKEEDGVPANLQELTIRLAGKLEIYSLVVHAVKEAACYENGVYSHTRGPYTPKPVITTGAGDNFNAGFCYAKLAGMSGRQALILGVATSGYYVRRAKSPTKEELAGFLREWRRSL